MTAQATRTGLSATTPLSLRESCSVRPVRSVMGAVVLSVSAFFFATHTAHAQDAAVTDPLAPALAQARAQGRRVIVEVSASWCVPCQHMETAVWTQRAVTDVLSSHFVMVKLDWDADEAQAIISRYHVKSLPSTVALRADGTEVDRLEGEASAPFVTQLLQAWRSDQSTLAVTERWLTEHPDDLLRHVDLSTRYVGAHDYTHALPHLQRVIALDPDNTRGHGAMALFTLGDTVQLRALGHAGEALEPLRTLVAKFPTTSWGLKGQLSLALAQHRQHHDDEAAATLTAYIGADTADGMTMAARTASVISMMATESWDLARAEQLGKTALERTPRNSPLLDAMAALAFTRGRMADALILEQNALRYDPSNREFRSRVARYSPPAPR